MSTISSEMYWICNSGTVDLLNYGFPSVVNWTHLKVVACGQLVESSDQKIVDFLMIQFFKLDPRTFPLLPVTGSACVISTLRLAKDHSKPS